MREFHREQVGVGAHSFYRYRGFELRRNTDLVLEKRWSIIPPGEIFSVGQFPTFKVAERYINGILTPPVVEVKVKPVVAPVIAITKNKNKKAA